MTIRRHVPWPLRLASIVVSVAVGAVAAIWLWQWLFGNAAAEHARLTGELEHLREQHAQVDAERQRLSAIANAADSQVRFEQSAAERMASQIKSLEAENGRLKADLAYLESLLPAAGTGDAGVTIRRFAVEPGPGAALRYRALLTQGGRAEKDFSGAIQLVVSGSQAGKPTTWQWPEQGGTDARERARLSFKRYQRLEGSIELPVGVTIRSVQLRVLENGSVRAQQSASP
jgi:hypothetical protein